MDILNFEDPHLKPRLKQAAGAYIKVLQIELKEYQHDILYKNQINECLTFLYSYSSRTETIPRNLLERLVLEKALTFLYDAQEQENKGFYFTIRDTQQVNNDIDYYSKFNLQ